jgi:hypothetical protein
LLHAFASDVESRRDISGALIGYRITGAKNLSRSTILTDRLAECPGLTSRVTLPILQGSRSCLDILEAGGKG